jgi:hypothetical protein
MRHRAAVVRALAVLLALGSIGLAGFAPAQSRPVAAGYATDDPNWRFTQQERRVKVVVLAGSIGAFRERPYARVLHEWCENAEFRNLSRVGQGTPQLAQRFRSEVLEGNAPIGAPGIEMWVMFGGGLNSVGRAQQTNRALWRLIEQAHRRRVRVVALTVTPWGSEEDSDRWTGGRALHLFRSTRSIVDFVMGRSSPAEALGSFRSERRAAAPDAPWVPDERPDVAVDLYDSRLRDRDAQPWPVDRIRQQLARDPMWRNPLARLADAERETRLDADARTLSEAPRWFLRREYQSFDHVHPNREGHQVIAETICPSLPASWGCRCPAAR